MDSEDTRGRVQDLEWTGARPTLSAIVCTFDRPESLSRLLDSFATQTGVPVDAYEVIVADNNPAGIAASSVREHAQRHPQIRYISAPFGGKCAALRVAINAAHGQILHFVDDDHLLIWPRSGHVQVELYWKRELHSERRFTARKAAEAWGYERTPCP